MAILGVLMTLAFGAFALSTRLFQDTTIRQSAEVQLRTIKVLLQRDLELTNFWQISHVPRTVGSEPRDAMALVGLGDWQSPSNFQVASDRPLWDRYIVWYATQQSPGRLVRQLVQPPLSGNPFYTGSYSGLSTSLSDSDPGSNRFASQTRVLSETVSEFELVPRLQNGTVRARIRLKALGGNRQLSHKQTQENLEVVMTFYPHNTWPKI